MYPKPFIPLHYFDFSKRDNKHRCSRLFRAFNCALDEVLDADGDRLATVLIAQINHSPELVAIEKLDSNLYSLTCFQPEVHFALFDSRRAQPMPRSHKVRKVDHRSEGNECWWDVIALNDLDRLTRQRPASLKRIAKNSNDVNMQTEQHITDAKNGTNVSPAKRAIPGGSNIEIEQANDCGTALTEIAFSLAKQYVEALYLSKTSLAYFTKGTLSRIRSSVDSTTLHKLRVLEFLSLMKEMILSTTIFDKKYRQIVPGIVNNLAAREKSNDKFMRPKHSQPKKERKLNKPKPKPNKDGLYSIEKDAIEQWWDAVEEAGAVSDHDQNWMKAPLAYLKFRESLLQIIMILEILALERQYYTSDDKDNFCQAGTSVQDGNEKASHGEARKVNKSVKIERTLEMLVDRLCIWHSLEAVTSTAIKKSTENAGLQIDKSEGDAIDKDQVREFYHHVLIPFYSRRLPDQVRNIGKRMGISKTSPERHSLRRRNGPATPGTDLKRRPSAQSEILRRPSSSCSARNNFQPPTCRRSVTGSLLGTDMRESSNTPQDQSSRYSDKRILSRTSSISTTTKLSQREVDMTAITKFNQSRIRHKPNVDKELHEAIATLKKPNRTVAVREYADSLDNNNVSLSKKPCLKANLPVEIGATPRRDRRTRIDDLKPADEAIPANINECQADKATVGVSKNAEEDDDARSMESTLPLKSVKTTPSHWYTNVYKTPSKERDLRPEHLNQVDLLSYGKVLSSSKRPKVKPFFTTSGRVGSSSTGIVLQSSPPNMQEDKQAQESLFLQRQALKRTPKSSISLSEQDKFEAPRGSIYQTLGWENDDYDELL